MKPDWDLMRKIALVVEDTPIGTVKRQPSVDGYTVDEVGYQIYLMVEAGLARGLSVRNAGQTHPCALLSDLTLAGHEFAELVRDQTRWDGAMAEARSTGPITLNALRRLLTSPQRRQSLPARPALSKPTPGSPAFGQAGIGQQGVPSDPAALVPGREYPRYIYHATKKPKMVSSRQEEVALGPEWSRTYIHQNYPKMKHHWSKPEVTVENADEEKALGCGWADTPGAFIPYRGARRPRAVEPETIKWLDEWTVPGLLVGHRKRIEAQLWKADGAFERSHDPDSGAVAAMRQAFDGIARVLFDAGILTEDLLRKQIPELVWDSAIAGEWWRLASESPQDIFPEQIGHYWVWRDEGGDWRALFRAETADWRGELLEGPAMEQSSWLDLRTEFENHASRYADRAERDAAEGWAKTSAGPWTLLGGSPRSERIFKEIAAKAAAKMRRSKGEESEGWQAWLDFMWREGWRRPDSRNSSSEMRRPHRITAQQVRQMGMVVDIQRIESVFQTSADCCQECADRETDQNESPVAAADSPQPAGESSPGGKDPSPDRAPDLQGNLEWDAQVDLLLKIVDKKTITVETWAKDKRLGRTSVFDWKAARISGNSLKGKVSDEKIAAIEKAIKDDAAALGLTTRTDPD